MDKVTNTPVSNQQKEKSVNELLLLVTNSVSKLFQNALYRYPLIANTPVSNPILYIKLITNTPVSNLTNNPVSNQTNPPFTNTPVSNTPVSNQITARFASSLLWYVSEPKYLNTTFLLLKCGALNFTRLKAFATLYDMELVRVLRTLLDLKIIEKTNNHPTINAYLHTRKESGKPPHNFYVLSEKAKEFFSTKEFERIFELLIPKEIMECAKNKHRELTEYYRKEEIKEKKRRAIKEKIFLELEAQLQKSKRNSADLKKDLAFQKTQGIEREPPKCKKCSAEILQFSEYFYIARTYYCSLCAPKWLEEKKRSIKFGRIERKESPRIPKEKKEEN